MLEGFKQLVRTFYIWGRHFQCSRQRSSVDSVNARIQSSKVTVRNHSLDRYIAAVFPGLFLMTYDVARFEVFGL